MKFMISTKTDGLALLNIIDDRDWAIVRRSGHPGGAWGYRLRAVARTVSGRGMSLWLSQNDPQSTVAGTLKVFARGSRGGLLADILASLPTGGNFTFHGDHAVIAGKVKKCSCIAQYGAACDIKMVDGYMTPVHYDGSPVFTTDNGFKLHWMPDTFIKWSN